jgi:hypothetical protein
VQPGVEVCDAIDNDCNGITDEGFGLGERCVLGEGACQARGVTVCDAEGGVQCATHSPASRVKRPATVSTTTVTVPSTARACGPPLFECIAGGCQPFVQPNECQQYATLSEADRNVDVVNQVVNCDNGLAAGVVPLRRRGRDAHAQLAPAGVRLWHARARLDGRGSTRSWPRARSTVRSASTGPATSASGPSRSRCATAASSTSSTSHPPSSARCASAPRASTTAPSVSPAAKAPTGRVEIFHEGRWGHRL